MSTPGDTVLVPATATGIGSLAHLDPGAAARFALEAFPTLPAVPSLPRRSPWEGILGQVATAIPGVGITASGDVVVDRSRFDPDAPARPDLDGEAFVGLRAIVQVAPERPLKAQLVGPVTLATALQRAGVEAGPALVAATQASGAVAAAILDRLGATRQQPAVLFVDEPGLVGLDHAGFPFAVDDAVDAVSTVLATCGSRAVTGVHCCGPTDWAAVRSAGPTVLSLPVDDAVTAAAPVLAAHLDGGGWVAWGAVPTHGPVGTSADPLWRRLAAAWCDVLGAGADPQLLRARALVTPACGLAGHGLSQARRAVALTCELAARVADQVAATFVSAGA